MFIRKRTDMILFRDLLHLALLDVEVQNYSHCNCHKNHVPYRPSIFFARMPVSLLSLQALGFTIVALTTDAFITVS